MQGQRGTIGSLPEIEFDLGSSSNNTTMDQQICWSNLRNPPENHIPEYLLSQNDMDVAFVNSMSRERQTLARWRSNEASSSNPQSEVSREKLELGWPSSGLRLEPSNNAAVPDSSPVLMFSQSSNTNPVQPSLNLGFTGQVSQFPSSFKFGGTESEQFLVGSESDGRQSSVDRGQVSCKRKAIEGSIGPSSSSNGSISYFQRSNTDLNSRPLLSTTAQNEAESGQSTFTPSSEQGAPTGLGLGFPEPNAMEIPESSQRNVRRRTSLTSSSTQQMVNASSLTSGRGSRRSGLLSAQHPAMNFEPVDLSLEPRTISAVDNTRNPSQVHVIDAPPLQQQTVHPLRWAGASLPRTGSSLSSLTFGERDSPVLPREELSSRAMARAALPERIHHTFVPVPDFRNMARHPRSVTGSSANASANGASSTSPAALAPSWQLHPLLPLQQQQQQQQQQHNHHQQQQQPRRMSDFLRRSLFPIVGTESSGGQGSNYAAAMRAGQAGSSNEMGGGAGNHHHHLQSNPRLATWLERHDGNNGLGMHYSLRALGVGPDNTTRLVSEQIRNVLGIIRRGESLRFEDVMILEPAMFAGMAEMHDRHRDMRLDVDHMSYEELLALEERIGNVSTGLSEETVLKCLKQKKYAIAENLQSETEPCCVCQEDYNEGEDIGILECGHDFHKDCIKQWLTQKNLCPICKTTALKM